MTFAPWKPEYELGIAIMDDTHREFIDWLNRLAEMPDASLLDGLDGFIAHTQAHFEQEDRWMRGSMFPPVACHSGMHAEILKIAAYVRDQVAKGNVKLGRQLVDELLPWFEEHAATMDTALGGWLKDTAYPLPPAEPTAA